MKTNRTLKVCGRQSEKVERHQVLYMIIEKAPPSRGRWRAMANHILGDGGLGNGDAQLCQLAMHAGSSPERVGPAHVPYQLTYFGSDAWSSWPTPSALPSPISSEPTTVPADDRLRFHDDEDALPVSPRFCATAPKTRGRPSRAAAVSRNGSIGVGPGSAFTSYVSPQTGTPGG